MNINRTLTNEYIIALLSFDTAKYLVIISIVTTGAFLLLKQL